MDFLEGDIDRPVVIAAMHNGMGQADQQHNQVGAGAGASTGNAPPLFPGEAGAHAHPAVLSGIKTQAMASSQDGAGAYNQLVLDDSAGQSRLALQRHGAPHKGNDELNLGHLRHQTDNQRLGGAGCGAELKTDSSAAVRAGRGMLLSTNQRTNAAGDQLDSREAIAQVRSSMDLQQSMAGTAQKHNAKLDGEAAADKLPAVGGMSASLTVIQSRENKAANKDNVGGIGEVAAYSLPHLQLSASAGIAATTPASAIISAGKTSSIVAHQDINITSQGNLHHSVLEGVSLFTYGKVTDAVKPNQETGIQLHSASGKVAAQAHAGDIRVTADKAIKVASVTKSVTIGAKQNVMLTAQGAFLKLEGGNIMLYGPGKIEFKASKKEMSGPANGTFGAPALPQAKPHYDEQFEVRDEFTGELMPFVRYCIVRPDGTRHTGITGEDGCTQRVLGARPETVEFHFGEPPAADAPAQDAATAAPVTAAPAQKPAAAKTSGSSASGAPAQHGKAEAKAKPAAKVVPPPTKAPLNAVKGSKVTVKYQPCEKYFRPETFEIIYVPKHEAAAFEKHALEMCAAVDQHHAANKHVKDVLDTYEKLLATPDGAGKEGELKRQHKLHVDAWEAVELANMRLRTKLQSLDSYAKAGKKGCTIVELVPLRENRHSGRAMYYVESPRIKAGWKTEKLVVKQPESDPGAEDAQSMQVHKDRDNNVLSRNAATGSLTVNRDQLAGQAAPTRENLKQAEFKIQILDFKKHQNHGEITEWVKCINDTAAARAIKEFNEKAKFDARGKWGKDFDDVADFKAEAQLCRYLGGVGADASFKPMEQKVGLKAEARAQISLASGKAELNVYWPNRFGCHVGFPNVRKPSAPYDVGVIRGLMHIILAGSAGAHFLAEGSIEFDKNNFMKPVPLTYGNPPAIPYGRQGRFGSAAVETPNSAFARHRDTAGKENAKVELNASWA